MLQGLAADRPKSHWCFKDWQPTVLGTVYELYMLLLILIFPLVAMTFAYVSICRELWTVLSTGRQVTSLRYFPRNSVASLHFA